MADLDTEDRETLQHALSHGRFASDDDDPEMVRLVFMGLMRGGRSFPGGRYFLITTKGEAAIQKAEAANG
jgi:hypothetical protein